MLAENALTTLDRMKLMLGLTNKDATLEKLKLMLGLPPDSEIPPEQLDQMLTLAGAENEQTDLIIELLINRASAWIERMTGRRLGKQSYRQWYDADGSQELVLLEYPIVSIESIKEDGALVPPGRYDFGQTGHIGVVYRDEGWLKAGWRRGLAYDNSFWYGINSINMSHSPILRIFVTCCDTHDFIPLNLITLV